MSESKMQNKATGSIFVSGAECDTTELAAAAAHQPIDGQSLDLARASRRGARRASSWRHFARRSLLSLRGGITSMVLASSAFAQQADPAPEEPAAEPAPAEPAPAEAAPPEAGPPSETTPLEAQIPAEGDVGSQDAADLAALDAEASPVEAGEAEVVVTVDRRTKSLQDYSGVASAFSEKKLDALGITNVRDLSAQVPGLKIANQEGSTEIFIRGVGSDNNTELGDPAVALHIDGVYIPRPRGLGTAFFDIERVEVSSGPQGTLRGRNALAGTVNIVTGQPKLGEFAANAEATFGNYSLRRYEGMVNIPIGDAVAFRFAGMSEVHDPFYSNGSPLYDIRAPEDADNYGLRGTFKYQPTQRFTAILGYDLTAERGVGYVGSNFQAALTDPDINFDPNDVDNPRVIYMHGMQPRVDMKHQGARADITFDTGPVIFNALASFRDLHYKQNTGSSNGFVYDGFDYADAADDLDGYGSAYWVTNSQSWIGELRAFAPDTSRFRWTVGGFFFDETQDAFLGQTSDPHAGYGGGEFNMPGVKGSSFAAYADGTFDITESFRVLAGVRVTKEHKDRKNGLWALWNNLPPRSAGSDVANLAPDENDGFGRYGTEGFKYKAFDRPTYTRGNTVQNKIDFFFDGIDSWGARDTVPVAICNDPPTATGDDVQQLRIAKNAEGNWRCTNGVRDEILNGTLEGWDAFANFYQYVPQNNEVDNTFFDWRVGLEYDLTPDNLTYATVSTGHKAGGFNDTQDFGMVDLYNTDYQPESMIAFEVGSKNTFLERKLRLNGAAFAYLYEDLVFQTIVSVGEDPDPEDPNVGPPASAVRQNAPSTTTVYGLDLDAAYALPAGLEIEVHALLMDSKFGDDTVVNDTRIGFGNNSLVDLGGNYLPRAPVFTLNYALSQLIFTPIGSFNWVIQGQTVGKHYLSVFNGDGTRVLPLVPSTPERPNPSTPDYEALAANPRRLNDSVDAYTRFDLGVGWTHPEGRLSINGYVNNLTDVVYATSINANPGSNLRFFNNPRTVGVRVKVEW